MGIMGAPLYGTDLGSAIEAVETIIDKIKTNRFDKEDLVELHKAVVEMEKAVNEAKN